MKNLSTRGAAVATGGASSGIAGALVGIITWGVGKGFKIDIPSEVAASFVIVLSPFIHLMVVKLGIDPDEEEDDGQPPAPLPAPQVPPVMPQPAHQPAGPAQPVAPQPPVQPHPPAP